MRLTLRVGIAVLAAAGLFAAGYAAGQNKFGKPKTIIHVSLIKWKPDVADAEKKKAMDGVLEMAKRIPGIKNVWLTPKRMQPRDYDTAFVLELEDEAAAVRYAEDPFHAEWSKHFLSIRQSSISPQITN